MLGPLLAKANTQMPSVFVHVGDNEMNNKSVKSQLIVTIAIGLVIPITLIGGLASISGILQLITYIPTNGRLCLEILSGVSQEKDQNLVSNQTHILHLIFIMSSRLRDCA